MMPKCVVLNCEDRKSKRHRFPHPFRDVHQRFNKWLLLTGNLVLLKMDPILVYRNRRVCGNHFSENLYVPRENKLKKNAIPDINLPKSLDALEIEGRQLQPVPAMLQFPLGNKVCEEGGPTYLFQDLPQSSAKNEWPVSPTNRIDQIIKIHTDEPTSSSLIRYREQPLTWDNLRALDLLPNLPSEIEILQMCLTLKKLRSSSTFKPCNIEEIDTLLTIASYWKKLIPEVRTLIFNRIRYLVLVAKYGWER